MPIDIAEIAISISPIYDVNKGPISIFPRNNNVMGNIRVGKIIIPNKDIRARNFPKIISK